jgi:hypothetical protein
MLHNSTNQAAGFSSGLFRFSRSVQTKKVDFLTWF